jgi:hypothetical protein
MTHEHVAADMKIAVAVAGLLLCAPSAVLAQARKVEPSRSEQAIGSWLLSCAADPMTDMRVCRMRTRLWLVPPAEGHPGMALEVQSRAGQLVPVVTIRQLSLSTAWSGLLALTATAQLRFDNAPMAELPCTLDAASVVCAPAKADAVRLVGELADAKSVLVRVHTVGNLPLPLPMPDGPLALDLDRTQEALARYRAAGPEVAPAPSSLTEELRDAVERLLRELGVAGTDPGQPPPN